MQQACGKFVLQTFGSSQEKVGLLTVESDLFYFFNDLDWQSKLLLLKLIYSDFVFVTNLDLKYKSD